VVGEGSCTRVSIREEGVDLIVVMYRLFRHGYEPSKGTSEK